MDSHFAKTLLAFTFTNFLQMLNLIFLNLQLNYIIFLSCYEKLYSEGITKKRCIKGYNKENLDGNKYAAVAKFANIKPRHASA